MIIKYGSNSCCSANCEIHAARIKDDECLFFFLLADLTCADRQTDTQQKEMCARMHPPPPQKNVGKRFECEDAALNVFPF